MRSDQQKIVPDGMVASNQALPADLIDLEIEFWRPELAINSICCMS